MSESSQSDAAAVFELESGWVIGRRFEATDPLIMSFSMKDLLLDLSRLLALALVDD